MKSKPFIKVRLSLRLSAALDIVKTSFPSALTCTKVLAKPKWTSPLGSFGLTKTFSKVQRRWLEVVQRNETGGYLGRKLGKAQKSSVSSGILDFRISKILGFIGGFVLSEAVRVSWRVELKETAQSRLSGVQSQGLSNQSLEFAHQSQALSRRGG